MPCIAHLIIYPNTLSTPHHAPLCTWHGNEFILHAGIIKMIGILEIGKESSALYIFKVGMHF